MKISPKLHQGTLLKRYKRFLADVTTQTGDTLTVHCPNTGSMRNCLAPGKPCWYSESDNPKRKYPHTLEIVTTDKGHRAGINTSRANPLVSEAISNGVIAQLSHYDTIKAEVKCNIGNSRMDFLLTDSAKDTRDCFVEVKNVTLMEAPGEGFFPDAVSERGAKHIQTLIELAAKGYRAVLIYCVQHTGIETVAPAENIDPHYATLLRQATQNGVEIYAYKAKLTVHNISLLNEIPVRL